MIHSSTVRGSESTWMDSIQSSKDTAEHSNSFEYAFSSLSLGGNGMNGNGITKLQQPALSVSSISSFGEETTFNNNKLHQDANGNGAGTGTGNNNGGYTNTNANTSSYAPPSPITPSSTSRNQYHSGMSLSSPIIGRSGDTSVNRYDYDETSTPRGIHYYGESPIRTQTQIHITPKKKEMDNHQQQQQQQQQYLNDYESDNGNGNGNGNSHINKGFHDLSNKQDDSLWSPRHGHTNRDFLSPSSNAKPDLRTVKSDITDESPFRNWPPQNDTNNNNKNGGATGSGSSMLMSSPGNLSTHSLQNMSSVDENEQLLGNGQGRNRARTLSAGTGGYRSVQNFAELTGQSSGHGHDHQRQLHESMNNHFMDLNNMNMNTNAGKLGPGAGFLNAQQIPHNPQLNVSNHNHNHNHAQTNINLNVHRQIGRVSSFPFSRSASNVIQEDLVHVHPNGNRGTLLNDHYIRPRQRVMSADAVNVHVNPNNGNGHSLNGLYGQSFYENQEMIANANNNHPQQQQQQQLMHHRSSSAGDISYNRPRSLSTGASNHGRNTRPFVDTSSNRTDGRGKYFSQMHSNDNHYPTLPTIQHKIMSGEEVLGFNGGMIHNHNVPPPPPPRSLNAAETYHYYQSQVVSSPMPSRAIYTVKFKRSQRNFVLSPRIQGDIKLGTHVKVEADRGEDLGVVLSRVPADKFNHSPRSLRYGNIDPLMPGNGLSMPDMKKILSVATNDEIALLQVKKEEEDELLKICRGKTLQRGLPMNVVDAEYQFDRHKLTFFFQAEGRIDFRELVRELFSIYKTRIWMQQIDKNSTNSGSNPNIAAATTVVSEDSDGTVSEKSAGSK